MTWNLPESTSREFNKQGTTLSIKIEFLTPYFCLLAPFPSVVASGTSYLYLVRPRRLGVPVTVPSKLHPGKQPIARLLSTSL